MQRGRLVSISRKTLTDRVFHLSVKINENLIFSLKMCNSAIETLPFDPRGEDDSFVEK